MIVLIVDGYNMIGDWPNLKSLKDKNFEEARLKLIDMLSEYQAFTQQRVIIVFDAYNVPGKEKRINHKNVEIIYTKEKETADEKIEKLVKTVKNVQTKVYVATSDYQEQWTVFSQGALRKSARELLLDVQAIQKEIQVNLLEHQKVTPKSKIQLDQDVLLKFEKMRRGKGSSKQ